MRRSVLMTMAVAALAFSVLFFGIGKGSAIAGPFITISMDSPDVDQTALPGEQIDYSLYCYNYGDANALNVVFTIELQDCSFVSGPAGCVESAGTVTCTTPTVGPGSGVTRTLVVLIDSDVPVGPSLKNSFSLSYSDGKKTITVNSDEFVTEIIGMEMKVHGQRFADPDCLMSYVVQWRNLSGMTVTNVSVIADLPPTITVSNPTYVVSASIADGVAGNFYFAVTVTPTAPVGQDLTATFTMRYEHSGGAVDAQAIVEAKTRIKDPYLTALESPIEVPVGHTEFFPDGKKLVFASYDVPGSCAEIFTINTDGSGLTQLTADGGDNCQPKISADGKKIAFRTSRNRYTQPDMYDTNDSSNSDIYVMNADGSNQTRLTYDPACQKGQVISPDGTKVVYKDDMDSLANQAISGADRLWVVDSNGVSDPILLPTSAGNDDENLGYGSNATNRVTWSPDSEWIIYRHGCWSYGDRELYKVKADGTEIEQLTFDGALVMWPVYSNDGSKILYRKGCLNDDDIHYLVVMDSDGYNQRTILTADDNLNERVGSPHWSPDDRWIAHTFKLNGWTTGDFAIWVTDSYGRFTAMLTSRYDDRQPKWSPKGDQILVKDRDQDRPLVAPNSEAFLINLDVSDRDGDGLANWEEDVVGSLRNDKDTDGDGVEDGVEFDLGTNPLVAEAITIPPEPEEPGPSIIVNEGDVIEEGCGCMVVGAEGSAPNNRSIAGMAFIYLIPGFAIILRKVYRRKKAV